MKVRHVIRFSFVVLMSLLLGVATTFGVAWAARWRFAPVASTAAPTASALLWPTTMPRGWNAAPDAAASLEGLAATDAFAVQYSPSGDVRVERAGWPCLALESVRRSTRKLPKYAPSGWDFVSAREGLVYWRADRPTGLAIWLPRFMGTSPSTAAVWLPLAPLWPGFAIDAGLYTAVWWTLLFGPLARKQFRRRWRERRGLCTACGYDLKGSVGGVCPECGAGAGGKM